MPYDVSHRVAEEEVAEEEVAEEVAEEVEEEDHRVHPILMSHNNPLNQPKM